MKKITQRCDYFQNEKEQVTLVNKIQCVYQRTMKQYKHKWIELTFLETSDSICLAPVIRAMRTGPPKWLHGQYRGSGAFDPGQEANMAGGDGSQPA